MEGVATDALPSLHAAVAGAASTVLTYLFPDAEAGRFRHLPRKPRPRASGPGQLPERHRGRPGSWAAVGNGP